MWTQPYQEAFGTVKQVLISSSVFSFPVEGEFILDMAAINHGISAILSQKQNGIEKVIAYLTKKGYSVLPIDFAETRCIV